MIMKALVYKVNPLGWLTCRWLKRFWRGCLTSKMAGLSLQEVRAPSLPTGQWVRLRTIMGGICGTDLAILGQKQAMNSILQAFSTQPMLLGHENVAVVEEVGHEVDESWLGRRVCAEPTLPCVARGIFPLCEACQAGQFGSCRNFALEGHGTAKLPPTTAMGYNPVTGGSYGEQFVAHLSQLVPVPDHLTDEQAVLTDSLACGLHAALRADVSQAEQVLVYGPGAIGLSVIAGLRATGYTGRIDVVGRRKYVADLIAQMGGDEFLRLGHRSKDRFHTIAERTGGKVHRARFGNYMLTGGYDVVFECTGTGHSLAECLKWTRSRGQLVLMGTDRDTDVDLTPVWFRELTVIGAYGRQREHYHGQDTGTYQLVHEMMSQGKINTHGLLTHTFPLNDYRSAFDVAMHKSSHKAVKVAFDFR